MNPHDHRLPFRSRRLRWFALVPGLALGFSLPSAFAASLPVVDGTAGNDTIDQNYTLPNGQPRNTHAAAEAVNGKNGDDIIHGLGGNDVVSGDAGDDELYGNAGDDDLRGGEGYDYLDDGEGTNRLDGGPRSDLIVGRGNRNTMIGNSGDDFFVIIGNAIGQHTILGDGEAPGAGPTDSNLLFFARDVNPDNMKVETYQRPQGPFTYAYLEFGLRTDQPVNLNVAEAMAKPFGSPGYMRHVQAFATGDGNDTVVGSSQVGASQSGGGTYYQRFLYLPPFVAITVDELFFTHAGDDTIETGGGRDYVDAGPGNDVIIGGPGGQNHILTGPGNDVIRWQAAQLNNNARHLVKDFTPGDTIEISGNVAPNTVTLTEADGNTTLKIGASEVFVLVGVPKANVQVQPLTGGGVRVALTGNPPPPPAPPPGPMVRQPGPSESTSGQPGGDTRPPGGGGPRPTGGTPQR